MNSSVKLKLQILTRVSHSGGKLSRELRSNQKTIEVLLEQYSNNQTH